MSNTGENLKPENAQQGQVNQITGDSRKFSEYVLVPNHKSGKDKIFLGLLGYRPNDLDDAQALLETYITQAQTRFVVQDYTVGEGDRHGQRFTIVVEIRGKRFLTGWTLDNQGTLKLAPHSLDLQMKATHHDSGTLFSRKTSHRPLPRLRSCHRCERNHSGSL